MARQVAEAIAAALKVEVEIVDQGLLRIAGTGLYKHGTLQTLATDGFVYRDVIQSGLPVIIDNPGHHRLCRPCIHYGNCPELAEVVVPIEFQGEVCGVIGLIAQDKTQRRRLLADSAPLLAFLTKMADLISTKLREQAVIRERTAAASQLEMVMNYLDRGIIALDEAGRVTHVNTAAYRLLGLRALIGEQLSQLVPGLTLEPEAEAPARSHVQWKRGNQRQPLVFTATPIRRDDRYLGMVVTLEDESRLAEVLASFANQALRCGPDAILGDSPAIVRVKSILPQIAQGEATVLISGESGTGKELVAQAIHTSSRRSTGPFIAVNCAAIPESLLESELFGYEPGAFTGARLSGKIGKFQLADGGTIFLDEIGDMPLYLQAKLLRVLQERYLERVGGSSPIPINVRIVAATNRDLEAMIAGGEFREDLFYRLNVIPIQLPPLRERVTDIGPLALHFLQLHAGRSGKELTTFTVEAAAALERYGWPGNIRELVNTIEYAVTMERSGQITLDSLPTKVREAVYPPAREVALETLDLRILERRAFTRALEQVYAQGQAKDRAADLLGISRATFFRKLREYGLERVSH
jgi:transcriptional regulator with PAS, ATPase and Fis domain